MNKELKTRIFDVPQDILDKINHTIVGLNGQHVHGLNRAKKILTDKKVKYGQLKRIIHDFKNLDKVNDRLRYDLYGGELMEKWSEQYLKGERDLIKDRKESKMNSEKTSGIGARKNPFLKKHTKKSSFLPPVNLIKSNSSKSTISPITSLGLFEEIEKIKKLITY